ncbi:MAG TPA: SDR family NAD(P)-dependent oxidoreductase [Pseudonocardiaceae bacterium]|jgi:NAD(P)-dependent dehydrogenase (short-subunit alcohol dehydrogenase family)|nr:SDR family NAD(P)-dependent oxidoreductase [Pseudonocardiaceae bacterium]
MTSPPIALVTGGNRGLGLEICRLLAARGHTVLLGSRDRQAGTTAAKLLATENRTVTPIQLDVTDPATIDRARDQIAADHGRLDVLVNNAGIFGTTPIDGDLDDIRAIFAVNLFGAWQTTVAFQELLEASGHGRVVNVSSGVGSFGTPEGISNERSVPPAYPISKAALNAFTVRLAIDWRDNRILVNAACPGFIATFPGAEQLGARPVSDGADSIVWAATLPDDGPTGGLFRDGQPLPW